MSQPERQARVVPVQDVYRLEWWTAGDADAQWLVYEHRPDAELAKEGWERLGMRPKGRPTLAGLSPVSGEQLEACR